MRVWILVFSVLIAYPILRPVPAHAAQRAPVILILLRSSTGTEASSLRSLIFDAIRVELKGRDITAVSSDEGLAEDSAVFSLAEKTRADFAISGTYTLTKDNVELRLRWYDVGQKKAFPDATKSGPLDLSFDSVVLDLVGEMLDGQKERLASMPPLPPPAAQPAAGVAKAVQPPAVFVPAGGAAPPEKVFPSGQIPKVSPLFFSIGSAPFIPVFKASAYIPTVGLSFSAEGEYLFPFGGGLLGIVVVSGMHFFHAEKASVADAFDVPIGAGVVYRTLTGSLIDFAVKAEAGPSIFVMTPAGGESSVGVVPFLSSGVGLTLNFSAHLGASVQIDYVAILVPDAIMGFVPSIGFDMRF